MHLFKDFLIVGLGSFLGGGSRFLFSKLAGVLFISTFPLGTFFVNLLGCFLIGFFSGLSSVRLALSPQTKLFLTTGFCGGLTTFSTFMNESLSLAKNSNSVLYLYLIGSFALGLLFVWAGGALAKTVTV
ncbi:putative fluoride ion transporter CrcB [Hallella multisaccharivorax DSM 17128]|uniref:Fluoride-specific ion channel FluC n=1 Tax=Hallella multisaccharivorax DSM 17128 TaxID=688246 RepID=F8NA73_9BACT|nr:CrcB family protein [Hallella multisaccharivorax]EGN56736.1 camphor resistance protein CrcB [Hallella multisaccharivorax DSM 17128]GJG30271.1 putative fluoride ion transporter CrcB [Hallella multisaccharivorax DSM 17128]